MKKSPYINAGDLNRVRFGELDEELSGAIAPMLQLPLEELTRLLLTLSPKTRAVLIVQRIGL